MRRRRTKINNAIVWLRSGPHLLGVLAALAGTAFSLTYVFTVVIPPDRTPLPDIPSELVVGKITNITGNNLGLVSGVQLSNGVENERILVIRGNPTRITILIPDGIPGGEYALEFFRRGNDDPVASGNTFVDALGSGRERLPEIKFADLGWKSAQIQNAIARKIIEEGYGNPTSTVFGPISRLWDSLFDGSIQIMMEVWLPNYERWWNEGLEQGSVIPLGKSLDENWQSSFVFPTYLAEQFPGLRSVANIPEFAHLFATPGSNGKAILNTCLAVWICNEINRAQVKAYGLEDSVSLFEPASENRLFGSLTESYHRGEPWLGYIWGPTKTTTDLDLTLLEEPPYLDACWETHKGCAYPTSKVRIAVHPEMIADAPEVMEFLRRWDLDSDTQAAIEEHLETTDQDFEATAVWFLRNLEVIWVRWVPSDVFEKVQRPVASQ